MSQPRNNLEALQRQIHPQHNSSYFPPPPSPKHTKFKPAKSGSASSVTVPTGNQHVSSFATPGYGKQKPRPPISSASLANSSDEAIDISPPATTSPSSIPYKRLSSDLAPALPNSPKRPRMAFSFDKENLSLPLRKGKEREGQSPTPSQHPKCRAQGFPSNATPSSSSVHPQTPISRRIPAANRPFAYHYKDHSDLQDKTAEQLQSLYDVNSSRFNEVRRERDLWRMRKASGSDPYILEGLLDLLEDRLDAITNAIAACGSDSEDMLTHYKPAAESGSTEPSVTRAHSYDLALDRETTRRDTQVIDEDFGDDGTYLSTTSHGSTLVSDIPDHVSGVGVTVDHGAQFTKSTSTSSNGAYSTGDVEVNGFAPTTAGLQSSHLPAFTPADELNYRWEEQHGPSSDDDHLWKHIDGEDDSVEVVSPDANQPMPSFGAADNLDPPPAKSPSEASLKASPHYHEVLGKLRNVFHLKTFRKNQLAAVISALDGRDTVVLMPTGGGKSLCFQLPAVCRGGKTNGVTFVISPLRTLMSDQVEKLRALNIDVMKLVSVDSQDGNTMQELRTASKKPSLVYITPEKLDKNGTMKATLKDLYERRQLARFVIDEAHLINTWGRDFRSAYGALCDIRKEYPDVPIVALTATATTEALQDIVTALGLTNYVFLSQSFNRPNLRYKVIPKKRDIETSIVQFIKEKYPNETGIIYCNARAKTEEVAMRLRDKGLAIRHFHAGMNDGDRKRIQQEWQIGDCKIIVATIAFGMGVDKANVRFVIHYDIPNSLDAYCQETGRAGRDGKIADCILYYIYSDIQRRTSQINKDTGLDNFQKERKRQALHAVYQFCINEIDCRRMLILNHFTEKFDPASCEGTCDNCASTDEVTNIDLTIHATLYVNMFKDLENKNMKITGPQSINAFRGKQMQEMARRSFDTLDNFAKGSDLSADLVKRLSDHLIASEILTTEIEEASDLNRPPISYVYLGTKAKEFLNKPAFVLKIRSAKRGISAATRKKGLQPPAPGGPSSIESRKKPTRLDVMEFNYDDIEIDPLPQESHTGTLPVVQAPRFRAAPSIQIVEHSTENAHRECLNELCALREKIARERRCHTQDILEDVTLETLSCTLPGDADTFREVLKADHGVEEADNKWIAFGVPCLNITSKYAMRIRTADAEMLVEMHKRFDYQGASSNKPIGR